MTIMCYYVSRRRWTTLYDKIICFITFYFCMSNAKVQYQENLVRIDITNTNAQPSFCHNNFTYYTIKLHLALHTNFFIDSRYPLCMQSFISKQTIELHFMPGVIEPISNLEYKLCSQNKIRLVVVLNKDNTLIRLIKTLKLKLLSTCSMSQANSVDFLTLDSVSSPFGPDVAFH
jgi:hypothetical protein